MVVDYSEEPLPTLTESSPQAAGCLEQYGLRQNELGSNFRLCSAVLPAWERIVTARRLAPNESYDLRQRLRKQLLLASPIHHRQATSTSTAAPPMFCMGTTNGTARQRSRTPRLVLDLQQISAVGTITTIGLGGEGRRAQAGWVAEALCIPQVAEVR